MLNEDNSPILNETLTALKLGETGGMSQVSAPACDSRCYDAVSAVLLLILFVSCRSVLVKCTFLAESNTVRSCSCSWLHFFLAVSGDSPCVGGQREHCAVEGGHQWDDHHDDASCTTAEPRLQPTSDQGAEHSSHTLSAESTTCSQARQKPALLWHSGDLQQGHFPESFHSKALLQG